jgi:cytochrome c-type biogenesis protein CcmH
VPDQPLAARRDLPAAGQQAAGGADKAAAQPDLARSAEALERKLKENPNDAEGWKLLGRTQAVLGRWNEAAASY